MGFPDFDLGVLKFSILGSGRRGGGLCFLHIGLLVWFLAVWLRRLSMCILL